MPGTDPDPAAESAPGPGLPVLPELRALADIPDLPTLEAVSRRPPFGGARRVWMAATVVSVHDETPRMKVFRLRLPEAHPHVPGQHVSIRLVAPDGYTAKRSYSICSAPGDGTEIEILVDRLEDGEVSVHLHDVLQVGDELDVRAPMGGWFVWKGQQPALLIGGGSGIAPLVAMLRYSRLTSTAPVHLVASVRTLTDLPFRPELEGAEEVTVVLTREAPEDWPIPAGRLSDTVLKPLIRAGATAYVCGSNGFAEHASQLLVSVGQPAGAVRVERYGATS
jgi:ferredoxin-NADP reductase